MWNRDEDVAGSLYQRVLHVLVDERVLTERLSVKTEVDEDLAKYADVFAEKVVGVQFDAGEIAQLVEMENDIERGRGVCVVLPPHPFEALASLTSLVQPEIGVSLFPVGKLAQSIRHIALLCVSVVKEIA